MILLELARFVEEKNRAMCHEIPDFCARVLAILANQAGISNSPFARPVRVGHDRVMATATRTQRRYDHRLRNLVRTTRDIHCAVQRGVPRSTARGWLTDSEVPVVTVEALNLDAIQLQREVLQLRRRHFEPPSTRAEANRKRTCSACEPVTVSLN